MIEGAEVGCLRVVHDDGVLDAAPLDFGTERLSLEEMVLCTMRLEVRGLTTSLLDTTFQHTLKLDV